MTNPKKELSEALLSQQELTGQELSLQEANAYVSGLTKALVAQSTNLGYQMKAEDAEQLAIQLVAKVDFTNPAVGHKSFNWFAKEILPGFIKQREEVEKWRNERG